MATVFGGPCSQHGGGPDDVAERRWSVGLQCRILKLKCCFTSTETVGLLGTEAQDVHLDFHTAPELDVAPGDLHGVEDVVERGGGGP